MWRPIRLTLPVLLDGKTGMRPTRIGVCHICGQTKKLSFEHCPPEKAFNDDPLVYAHMQLLRDGGDIDDLKGKKHQRGAGANTLCDHRNNDAHTSRSLSLCSRTSGVCAPNLGRLCFPPAQHINSLQHELSKALTMSWLYRSFFCTSLWGAIIHSVATMAMRRAAG